MGDIDSRLGYQLLQAVGNQLNALDSVEDVEDLTTPRQLSAQCLPDDLIVIWPHMRENGQAFFGRRIDGGQIAQPG